MNTRIEQLGNIPFFHGLSSEALMTLAEKVRECSISEGEVLVREGDEGDSMFMIVSGKVKIVKKDIAGNEIILNDCGPGEAIGEMSLLDQQPRSASIVAVSPTTLLELKRETFLDILDQQPEIALMLIRSMSARLRFAATYIQQVTEWSKRIAEGDYASAMNQMRSARSVETEHVSDEVKAGQLLLAFFQMVQDVKAREDELKQQLHKLTLEIDEARRRQQVREVTNTDFFSKLKIQAEELRRQRREES